MQRITITLDDDLAEQFEAFRTSNGYANRSEAFRDLVRERLGTERLKQEQAGDCLASLTYVYDHHERALAARTTRVHHDHHDLTVATLHIHLDHRNCMETVILRGRVVRVEGFAKALAAQPGIRHARVHILPVTLREESHGHGTPQPAHSQGHPHVHVEPIG